MPRRIAVVLGTRPEFIKMAEIVRLLGEDARVIHTGQHYDPNLSGAIIADVELPDPEVHLGVGGADRARQVSAALAGLADTFDEERPAAVVVQGDTNAVLAGALAANAAAIPLIHIEAGLRSFDRSMPEEHNRVVADHLADLNCAPTSTSVGNLAADGIRGDRVVLTGNTVVEAVRTWLPDEADRRRLVSDLGLRDAEYVVATLHRPENVDAAATLETILRELAALPLPVALTIHPRTRARIDQFGLQRLLGRLRVLEPLSYRAFLALMAEASLIVSDSGGIQEEASVLKRPVVVVRRSTERPEVLGTFAHLVAPGPEIGRAVADLADVDAVRKRLSDLETPYGDGTAARRCVEAIVDLLAV